MNYNKIDPLLSDNSRTSTSKLASSSNFQNTTPKQTSFKKDSTLLLQDSNSYDNSRNYLIPHKQKDLFTKLNASTIHQHINITNNNNNNKHSTPTDKINLLLSHNNNNKNDNTKDTSSNNAVHILNASNFTNTADLLTHLNKTFDINDDPRQFRKVERICDSYSEEEDSDKENDFEYVIMPDNKYKGYFDCVLTFILVYSSIILPYTMAFYDNESTSDKVIDWIFTFILLCDIVLSFFSAYIDNDDNVIKNRKRIIHNYIKSWFVIDVLSIVPFNYFTFINHNTHQVFRVLRMFKLIRITKLLKNNNAQKVITQLFERIKISQNIKRLIIFIYIFLLLNHISSCIWYFVAKVQNLNPDSWVTRLGYIDSSNYEIYIISFYWTLTTITTVGYGDISAGSSIEKTYNLFLMIFGVIIYSFAIGSLSSIVSSLDSNTAEMNQKLQILSRIKREFNLDQDIYDKIRKVIKYDLSNSQKDKMDFLQELPNKLRIELSHIMHDNVISKMYFFKNQPNDFIAYVAPLLLPVKYGQGDYLYKCNDTIDEMYFVSKGTIVFCLSKEYNESELKEVKKHNNFGEIEMCLNEKLTYNIKVKSRNSELYVLKKNDFLKLSVNFKDFIEMFLQKSLSIYLRFTELKTKVVSQVEEMQQIQNEIRRLNTIKQTVLEKIEEKEENSINDDILIPSSASFLSEYGRDSKEILEEDKESEESSSMHHVVNDECNVNNNNNINERGETSNDVIRIKECNKVSNTCLNMRNQNQKSEINTTITRNYSHNVNKNNTINKKEQTFQCDTVCNSLSTINQNNQTKSQRNVPSLSLNGTKLTLKDEFKGTLSFKNNINNICDNCNCNNNNKSSVVNITGINSNKQSPKLERNHVQGNNEDKKDSGNNIIMNNDNKDVIKTQMNQRFIKKINKIIEFIEKYNIQFDKKDIALTMLNKLLTVINMNERNELLDKLGIIINDTFKKQ